MYLTISSESVHHAAVEEALVMRHIATCKSIESTQEWNKQAGRTFIQAQALHSVFGINLDGGRSQHVELLTRKETNIQLRPVGHESKHETRTTLQQSYAVGLVRSD